MNNSVIILGINHQSTLAFVRCFGEAGVRPICVMYGQDYGLVFSSKYPSVKHHVKTAEEGLEFIINKYSKVSPRPFLFGSNDKAASVINANFDRLKDSYLMESANDTEGEIIRLMDKWEIYRIAEKFGLTVPKTILLSKDDEVPNDLDYPVFTKSMRTIDGGKVDEKICYTIDELKDFLRYCHASQIMVQKYIFKKDEFNYYGFSYGGQVFIPYTNIRPRFSDAALGGYHYFVPPMANEHYSKVVSMMQSTGYNGLFSVEFLRDKNDKLYFMEINFRQDGDTYLLMPGINLPMEYCERVLGKNEKLIVKKKRIVGMRELVDYNQSVKTGKVSKIKWLWQFMTADTHILWNWRDMGPIWNMLTRR